MKTEKDDLTGKSVCRPIGEVYQVVESYWLSWDGYTPPKERALKTFADEQKATNFRDKLEEERKMKEKVLEDVGKRGYCNKFTHYTYHIDRIIVE